MNFHKMARHALATALVAGALVAGFGAPAQAAESTCNSKGQAWLEHQAYGTKVPLYNTSQRCKLTPGDGEGGYNAGVEGLQYNLNKCMRPMIIASGSGYTDLRFDPLVEDGEFGSLTKNALIKVQKYVNRYYGVGIATDGGYGPQTRSWMEYWDGSECGFLSLP
ncbi:peptidoglycan-binding domain-containing protein [Catellatospora vulcania]|uniref:peptidoglycan-binding domain-containing protein n=1 Tax=Catellatospora vulcania TaxID=1460450 RepID=UPI0012D45B95|nr:hypothetical protein [Catellatospora vulcania]